MTLLRARTTVGGLALVLVAAGCTGSGSAGTSSVPSTTSTTTTTIPTMPSDCSGEAWTADLDGLAGDELVVWRDLPSGGLRVEICQDGRSVAGVDIDDPTAEPLGIVDLGDGGILDLLVTTTDGDRVEVRGITLGLAGLGVTEVLAERWIEGSLDGDEMFEGRGFECDDVDGDGDRELLAVTYLPADTFDDVAMHVRVNAVLVEAGVTTYGVEVYETSVGTALGRWEDDPRCAPGSGTRVEVRSHRNGWSRLVAGETFASPGSHIMTGVAYSADLGRYVIVGTESATPLTGEYFKDRVSIWHSTDAVTWVRADLGQQSGEARAVTDLPDGGGFVAVGSTGLVPTAWVSADGIEWQAVEVPAGSGDAVGLIGPVMSDVVATPFGIVAVGTEDLAPPVLQEGLGSDLDAAVWISSNGFDWRRIEHPAFGSVGYQPNTDGEFNSGLVGVVWSPDIGLVAVGSASESDPSIDYPMEAPMAWVSSDGETWERHPIGLDMRVRGVVAVDGGIVVVGLEGVHATPTSDAAIASSVDGVGWQPASGTLAGASETDGVQSINGGVSLPSGVAVFGSDEIEIEARGGAAVWWSSDGATWGRELHDDAAFGIIEGSGTATMTSAVWDGARLVVVGFSGRPVEYPGGIVGCCVMDPAIWYWPAEGEHDG